jgi:TP901 family phage tail tape measure protein
MSDVNANINVNINTSDALSQLKSLQRQISEFHTSVAKSSAAAALAQKSLQTNLISSINATGAFSAELRTVKTTAESFTASLEGNKFSMRDYFRYAAASTKTFGKLFKSEYDTIGKVAEDRVKKLQTQYIKMGRDASGAMKAIAVMPNNLDMSNFSTQTQIASQRQALFNQLMKQGSTNLLNFGKNTQWAGRQLMVGFSIPLLAVGSQATKVFMDMETQALRFKKVYGDLFTTPEETSKALSNIKELGQSFTQYGIAVSKTVGLAADAAAAGFQGLDLQNQTIAATKLSILGQIDQQQALQTTISLQNAFGISSVELASNIDFLNAVENQTVTSLDDITTAIPKVAPVIKQLGGDVKDLAFFLTAMKEGGVSATEGANALKSGLASLINPSQKASDMLASVNINISDIVTKNRGNLKQTVVEFANALDTLDPLSRARAIETMFGKFQFARISTLLQNVNKEGNQAARVLALAGSSAQDLANLSQKELDITASSAMNKFKKSIEDLKVALVPVGEVFLKTVTPIIEFISKILDKFNNLSDGTKKAITLIITVIGGLGPILLMTFGLLANGVANIIKLFLTLRNGYQRLTGQSQNLGEQTQYLTSEQLDAAAAAHSLEQSHARLTQQFTVEAAAVNALKVAYQSATMAASSFALNNPAMMMPPRAGKRYAGGVQIVPGSGNGDTVPAMLTPGEAVIPKDMTKKYGGLINGMIAGNIPGYASGTLGEGNDAWIQNIANVGISQGSKSGIASLLSKDIGKILKTADETLLNEYKAFIETLTSSMETITTKTIKNAVRQQETMLRKFSPQSFQQEKMQFSHIGSGENTTAGELQRSGRITDSKTAEALAKLSAILPEKNLGLKSGFGIDIKGSINNDLGHAGASLQELIKEFETNGIQKYRKMIEIGGGNFDNLSQQITEYDKRMTQTLQARMASGKTIIVDSQAQIDAARASAIASGKSFDESIYTTMESIDQEVRSGLGTFGTELNSVIQTALNTITEVRLNLTPAENALLGGNFLGQENGQARLSGRIDSSSTNKNRKFNGVGKFNPNQVTTAGSELGILAITGLASGTQSASDSKKATQEGNNVVGGFVHAIEAGKDDANMAGQQLGNAGVDGLKTASQSSRGVTLNTRRATRPQGAPTANVDGVAPTQTVAKTAKNLDGLNQKLMGASFALTSLAGIGSMFGGNIAKLSSVVFNLSGAMFGLMTVTQLMTKTNFAKLASDRIDLASNAMRAMNIASLASGAGPIKGFLPKLGQLAVGLGKLIGPMGGLTLLVGAGVVAYKFYAAAQERARIATEGLANGMTLAADKVKTLAELLGQTPTERTGGGVITNVKKDATKQSKVEELKNNEDFQKIYSDTIKALKINSQKSAMIAFKSIALDLSGQGFSQEAIDTIIQALSEKSGKSDLYLKFKKINLDTSTVEGQKEAKKLADELNKGFDKEFKGGIRVVPPTAVRAGQPTTGPRTTEQLTKGQQKALKESSTGLGDILTNLGSKFTKQSIKAAEYKKQVNSILNPIKNNAAGMKLLSGIIENTSSEYKDAADKTTDYAAKMLLTKASILGLNVSQDTLNQLMSGSATEIDKARVALEKLIATEATDKNAPNLVVPNVTIEDTGPKQLSPIQQALKDLKQQRSDTEAQTKAYGTLIKAGYDAKKAAEMVNDVNLARLINSPKAAGLSFKELKKLIDQSAKALEKFNLAQDPFYKVRMSIDTFTNAYDLMMNKFQVQQEQAHLMFDPLIEAAQKAIDEIQTRIDGINKKFDKQLAPLNAESSILSNNLAQIDHEAAKVNEQFDKQQQALTMINKLEQQSIALNKTKVSLADALTSGDMSAAAQAVQDMRSQQATNQGDFRQTALDNARKATLDQITAGGMTRAQIEERQYAISQQIFTIEQARKAEIDAQNILLEARQGDLDLQQQKLEAQLAPIEAQILAWNREKNKLDIISSTYDTQNIQIKDQEKNVRKIVAAWEAVAIAAAQALAAQALAGQTPAPIPTPTPTPTPSSTTNTKKLVPGTGVYNGSVFIPPRYEATGGHITGPGTGKSDSIPAMLSNGEYVIQSDAVNKYGVGFFDKVNAKKFSRGGDVEGGGYGGGNSTTSNIFDKTIKFIDPLKVGNYSPGYELLGGKEIANVLSGKGKKGDYLSTALLALPGIGKVGKIAKGVKNISSKISSMLATRFASGNVSESLASTVLKNKLTGAPSGITGFNKQDLRGWNWPATYLTEHGASAAGYAMESQKNYGFIPNAMGSLYNFKANAPVNILNMLGKATKTQKNALSNIVQETGARTPEELKIILNTIKKSKTLDQAVLAARSLPFKSLDLTETSQIARKMKDSIGKAVGITDDGTDLITNFRSSKTITSRLINQLNNKLEKVKTAGISGGINYQDDLNQTLIMNMKKFGNKETPLLQDLSNIPGISKKALSKMSQGFNDFSSANVIARSKLGNWTTFLSQFNPYKKTPLDIRQNTAKMMLHPLQFSQNKVATELYRILTGGKKFKAYTQTGVATGGYINNGKVSIPKMANGGFINLFGSSYETPSLPKMADGGLVSKYLKTKYFAEGGYAMGTDTVPAMLTPGEFVVNKKATQAYQPLLTSINSGSPINTDSSSPMLHYNNYSVNVSMNGNNINPDLVANAVITKIKNMDKTNIRRQKV